MNTSKHRRVIAMRALACFVLALLMAGWPPSSLASEASPIVDGSDGPGYVAIILEPVNGLVDVEGLWSARPKAVWGSLLFDAHDPNFTFLQGAPGRDQGDRFVEARLSDDAHYRFHLVERNDTVHVTERWVWDTLPIGVLFFAAGAIDRFDVVVHSGRIVAIESGTDAVAAWADDFSEEGSHVSVRAFGNFGFHERATSSFELPRGFFGEFGGDTSGAVMLTSPTGTTHCPCSTTPQTSVPGRHVVTLEGAGYDGLMYWAVAPKLPRYHENST